MAGRRRAGRLATRQGVRLGDRLDDIDAGITTGFELFDEFGHGGHRFAQQRHDVGRALERLVDDAIEQILDCPGELADELRADHAAAAFQRME